MAEMLLPTMNILTVSRPRFWFYLLGPYIIGILAAFPTTISAHTEIALLALFVYFLFPANLMVYGVNDIFDYETDKLNAKKSHYEALVTPESHRKLLIWITVLNIPFLIGMFWTNLLSLMLFISFCLLSVFYSANPIRAKTKPILDSLFNVLYIFPALIGYTMAGGRVFAWPILLAATLWVVAMHAYSAVPDIESDRKAFMNTIATFLGKNGTLTICTLCYLGSSIIAAAYLGPIMYILGFIYLWMMRKTFQAQTPEAMLNLYAFFPKLNLLSGFVIFCVLLYLKYPVGMVL